MTNNSNDDKNIDDIEVKCTWRFNTIIFEMRMRLIALLNLNLI